MKLICFVGKGGVGKSFLSVREFLKTKDAYLIQVDRQNNASFFTKSNKNVFQIEENTLLEEIIGLTPYKEFADLIRDIAPDFKLILGLLSFLDEHKEENKTIIADFPPNCETLSLLTLPDITKTIIFRFIKIKEKVASLIKKEKSNLISKGEKLRDLVSNTLEILQSATWKIVSVPDELSNLEATKIHKFLSKFINENGKLIRVLNQMLNSSNTSCLKCNKKAKIGREIILSYNIDEVVEYDP